MPVTRVLNNITAHNGRRGAFNGRSDVCNGAGFRLEEVSLPSNFHTLNGLSWVMNYFPKTVWSLHLALGEGSLIWASFRIPSQCKGPLSSSPPDASKAKHSLPGLKSGNPFDLVKASLPFPPSLMQFDLPRHSLNQVGSHGKFCKSTCMLKSLL